MDPFVPEPEERLAHQETAAKARPRSGDQPPPTESSLWPDGLREYAKLIIPLAVILALMLIQYGVHSSSINRLEDELASLKTINTKQLSTAGDTGNSSLAEVQQDISEQADLIRTLEQRIATQIIDIDTLRSSVGGQGSVGSAISSADRVEMEQIRNSLKTFETRLATLGGQADKSLAQIGEQDKRLSDVQKTLQNQLAEAGKAQQAAQQKLAAVDNRLDESLGKTETKVATLSSNLDRLQNELQGSLADQQKLLTNVEKSVTGLDSKIITGLTSNKAELDKAQLQLDGKVAAVTSRISSVESTQKSVLDNQQKLLTDLEKSVAELNSKIDGVENAQKVALTSQAKSLQSQLISQLDSRLASVSKQAAGVTALEQKLTSQLSEKEKALAQTRQQLAALSKTVDMTAAANGDSGRTIEANRKALSDIETKLAAMTSEMDTALDRLHSQEAAIKEQQKIVNSNGANPFDDQIARQIDAKLAPQAQALGNQAELLKSLETKLAAQLADIDGLRGTSAQLSDEISATRSTLEQARQGLEQQKSFVEPEQLDSFMTAVKLELTGLNRDLEGAVAKISQQESQLAQWRSAIDKRIASQAGSGAAGGADTSVLQDQLAAQLQEMDKLRSANTQLAGDVSSTRQQLEELRKALDKPAAVSSNASGAAGEAELLAIQAQVDDMTRKLESSTNRLSLQEKTFNQWQLELENRLAINEQAIAAAKGSAAASSDTSIDAELNHIKRTIVALKKQHPFVEFPGD